MQKKEWFKPTISSLNEKILSGSSYPQFAEQVIYVACVSGVCAVTSSTSYSSVSGPPGVNGSCGSGVVGALCS